MARAIAFDALDLAKKIKPDQAKAWMKGLGDNGEDEGKVLRRQIEEFLESLRESGASAGRLKDAWSLFRRPFYLQGLVLLGMASSIAYAIQTAPPPKPYVLDPRLFTPSQSYTPSNPYVPPRPAYAPPRPVYAPPRPVYVRPTTAPNGNPWPATADYVAGYPHTHTDGYSKVTIDNSQNDSDVFVKLVSLDGAETFPVRVFFIPAGASSTLDSVTPGDYDIRYRDLDSGSLSRSQQFSLKENKTYNEVHFSNIKMTLYKVRNGNMQTYPLSEAKF